MNGDGNVITECVVVKHIDTEEQHNVDDPAANGNLVGGQEKGWP